MTDPIRLFRAEFVFDGDAAMEAVGTAMARSVTSACERHHDSMVARGVFGAVRVAVRVELSPALRAVLGATDAFTITFSEEVDP